LEPAQTNKKAINHASFIVFTASLLGGCNHVVRDDATIWVGQDTVLDFTGDNLLDLILQPKRNLCNFLRSNGGLGFIGGIGREYCDLLAASRFHSTRAGMTYADDVPPRCDV
jgi:hypothetical protein